MCPCVSVCAEKRRLKGFTSNANMVVLGIWKVGSFSLFFFAFFFFKLRSYFLKGKNVKHTLNTAKVKL